MPEKAAIALETQLKRNPVFKRGHTIGRSGTGDIPIDHRSAIQSIIMGIVQGRKLSYATSPKSGQSLTVQFFQK